MPNYHNGKIYKITSHRTTAIYIGSTTRSLSDRFVEHKSRFKMGKIKCISSEILKYGGCEIELIENYPCNNKQELREREGLFQTTFQCVNNFIAGRTNKQYYIDNKERILNIANRQHTCICGASMQFQAKSRHEKTNKHKKYIENLT